MVASRERCSLPEDYALMPSTLSWRLVCWFGGFFARGSAHGSYVCFHGHITLASSMGLGNGSLLEITETSTIEED